MQSVPREWLDFLRQQFPKDSRIQLTEITKPVNIGAAAPLSQEGGLPYQTYMRLRVSNRIRMACLETWKI